MRTSIITVIVMLIALPFRAQQQDVKTQSVEIQDFINFIAENYEYQEPENENEQNHNITFLLQVANTDLKTEDQIILKQGFKLLSKRLNDYNNISILTYFGYNGTALRASTPTDLPLVYNTLANLKSKITEFKDDGIDHAYKYANNNFKEGYTNTIVIVRNSNAGSLHLAKLSKKEIKKIQRKKKKGDILKVAVSLVPEIIAILKN